MIKKIMANQNLIFRRIFGIIGLLQLVALIAFGIKEHFNYAIILIIAYTIEMVLGIFCGLNGRFGNKPQ